MEFTNVSFSIDLDSGNSALVDDPGSAVAHILRKIANEIAGEITSDDLEQSVAILDTNGNTVGSWSMTCKGEESEGCSECGNNLDDGEGYDGLCGSCADQADEIEEEKTSLENVQEYRDSMHLIYEGGEPGQSLADNCSETWAAMTDKEAAEYRRLEALAIQDGYTGYF